MCISRDASVTEKINEKWGRNTYKGTHNEEDITEL